MVEAEVLTAEFEAYRPHLRAVAYRVLGSSSEADDAVQETWLRLSRADVDEIESLGGWLTTVTARICLDMLRARGSRREDLTDAELPREAPADETDPEHEALLADALGPALLALLDTLTPSERLAVVLHDLFDVPFDQVGAILGRSPNAAKQLASRGRRRLERAPVEPQPDPTRERDVVHAFLAASRSGDFEALVALLDPEIAFRADAAAVEMGALDAANGAPAVAAIFSGRALEARPALVDGLAGVVWAPGDEPRVVWDLTIDGDRVVRIDMVADAASLAEMELEIAQAEGAR